MANPSRDDRSEPKRMQRNSRSWDAIRKALEHAEGASTIVDLPGGDGPFSGLLARAGYQVVGGDTAIELPRAEAAALPFASKSVDCLVSVGSLFTVDADTRQRRLREFGRVSRRWIIADYRHRYSLRYGAWKIARVLGLTRRTLERVSLRSMKSEFEHAGLRIVRIIPVRRFLCDKWMVLAESGFTDPQGLAIKLRGTRYADLAITEKLGEGKRSVVYRARWNGRDVGAKVYKPAAIADHARKHPQPLAEFEHQRNKAFFEARGLAKYVAEPLGFVVEPGFQMSLQELVDGEVYYFAQRDHADFISPRFMDDLAELVTLSHQARLYDIDLHAMNVMVDRHKGSPKLFDFNQIPFTERPQNPLVGLALKLGLLGRESRDLRKLAQFRNFERIERRLLRFYEESGRPPE